MGRKNSSVVPPKFAQKACAHSWPVNGGQPSAPFLAAAPGRTKRRSADRLSADDRSSLHAAKPAIFPFLAFLYFLFIAQAAGSFKCFRAVSAIF